MGWLGSVQMLPGCFQGAFPSQRYMNSLELHNAHHFNKMKPTCEEHKVHTLGKDAGGSKGGFACSQVVTGRCGAPKFQHRPLAAANVRLTLQYLCNVQHSQLGLTFGTVAVWLSFGPIWSRISPIL